MLNKLIALSFFLSSALLLNATDLNGKVFIMGSKQTLAGASVYWQNTTIGTTTDEKGLFSLPLIDESKVLIISYVGFTSDTVLIKDGQTYVEVSLNKQVELNSVEITAKKQASAISTLEIMNTEMLTEKEFLKSACCNLSESFETNATVDVNFTDAVSGARKIQMLGLDGVYSQILFEGLPYLRGLSSSRGLSYIPGTWLESISITKGTGSVANGFESMSGQINMEFLKPEASPMVYVNLFANEMGRNEANVHLSRKFNKKWSSALFLHGSDLSQRNDRNKDGFLDMPLKTQLNMLNRWKYSSDRYMAQFGFRLLNDENTGGQLSFDRDNEENRNSIYGVKISSREGEFFFKNGLMFPSAPKRSLALVGTARRSEQDYFFGLRDYVGNQNTVYLNLIYQSTIFSNQHVFKVGSSFMHDNYQESYNDSAFSRNENIPGLYGEYTYTSLNEKIIFNLGLRNDFHNLYGNILSPRLHVKYNPHPLTSFRISGGRGFRTANIYAENTFALASSRRVEVVEKLQVEKSWNAGISLTHKFKFIGKQSYINLDYFRTEFENQVVVDLEQSDKLRFYNLNGQSYSNSVQLDFGMEFNRMWDMKMAAKLYDVQTTFGDQLKARPLVKKVGGLLNIGYESNNENWRIDGTTVLYGSSRLPSTELNPENYRLKSKSDPYMTISAQVTRKIKRLEIYLGCENLGNFKQPNAIIAANDPFGRFFDASLIWGPIAGRTIYGGLKYYVMQKSKK